MVKIFKDLCVLVLLGESSLSIGRFNNYLSKDDKEAVSPILVNICLSTKHSWIVGCAHAAGMQLSVSSPAAI